MHDYDERTGREERRRRFMRHLPWIIPAFLVVGTGLFIGIGQLVVWLWRVTLSDIFGIKAISFWQAWGIILLSQILFKANMRPVSRTGRWQRGGRGWAADTGSRPPAGNPETAP